MNPISEAVAPYALYVKLGLAVAIAGTLLFQCHRINTLEADAVLYKAATQGYAQAQQTNLDTIDVLRVQLADVVEANRMDEARAAAAATRSSMRNEVTTKALAAKEKELADVYAHNANARAWGNTGVDAAVLARLPKHAAARADQDRREAGARAGAAAEGTSAH
jgi:hypothetical protein